MNKNKIHCRNCYFCHWHSNALEDICLKHYIRCKYNEDYSFSCWVKNSWISQILNYITTN